MSISVIILTFNEEKNLPAALDSVRGWASEVFVVDSYSTDGTVGLALGRASQGVRVVQHSFENYSAQWNWALQELPLRGDWTLKLDADERVTDEFKRETKAVIAQAPPDLEGLYFRRRIFFMGHLLRWGGSVNNYDLRMWRTGKARFESRAVNEHAIVRGETFRLRTFVNHFDYKSISDWIEKHNRYSSLEARSIIDGDITGELHPRLGGKPDQHRMWLRKMYYRLPARQLAYFIYHYFFRLGFLDGRPGLQTAFLRAAYLYWIDLKIREYKLTGNRPEVAWPHRGQPDPRLIQSRFHP